MRKIREVLRLRWGHCLSQRDIAASCEVSCATVTSYLTRAEAAGLSWPLPQDLTDAELEGRLFPPGSLPGAARPLPDWKDVHCQLRRKGVTLELLWQEYRSQHPAGYGRSRFCELYQQWRGTAAPVMRQRYRGGEKLLVDFAGMTIPVGRSLAGKERPAQIFVAALGASNFTYAEAVDSQTTRDWVLAHVRCLEFLGGVPEVVVPDNITSGIKSACYYEPDFTEAYRLFAVHYGTAIIPARVRRPRDKAKVENAVQQVERWILAPLRDRRFFSLAELNAAVSERLSWLNDRPGPGLPASLRELFETLDKPFLKPLPAEAYEPSEWKKATVHIDYHVDVERHYYSVPYQLVRKQVEVRLTGGTVEIIHRGERVASHQRSTQKFGFTTLPEHMPPQHRAQANPSGEWLFRQARAHGCATEQLLRAVVADRSHPVQGYRCCQGILSLAKIYGSERLERASLRALQAGALSYHRVKAILANGLDSAPLPETAHPVLPIEHENVRGGGYYH